MVRKITPTSGGWSKRLDPTDPFADFQRQATRALAAELLGELSRSRQTGAALHELANSRWGLSEETRKAAAAAAKRIGQRLAGAAGGAPA